MVAEAPSSPADPVPLPHTVRDRFEREPAATLRLVTRPDVSRITITGPGDAGKTRLARHLAGAARGTFSDGVPRVLPSADTIARRNGLV